MSHKLWTLAEIFSLRESESGGFYFFIFDVRLNHKQHTLYRSLPAQKINNDSEKVSLTANNSYWFSRLKTKMA